MTDRLIAAARVISIAHSVGFQETEQAAGEAGQAIEGAAEEAGQEIEEAGQELDRKTDAE